MFKLHILSSSLEAFWPFLGPALAAALGLPPNYCHYGILLAYMLDHLTFNSSVSLFMGFLLQAWSFSPSKWNSGEFNVSRSVCTKQNKSKSYFLALMSFFTETLGDFSPWWDPPYGRDNLYSTQLCLLSTHFCSEKSSRDKTPVLVRSLAALIAVTSECLTWHCPPLRALLVFLFHREVIGSKSVLPFRHRQKPKLVFKFAF